MDSDLLETFFLFGLGTLQFAVAGFVVWQRGWTEWATRLFAAYVVLAGLWEWVLGLGPWVPPLRGGGLTWLGGYVLLGLAFLFYWLTRAFLRLGGRAWIWWLPAAAGGVLLGILQGRLISVPPALALPNAGLGLAFVGWAVYAAGTSGMTIRSYRGATQPLHRNRISYWFVAIALALLTDLAYFAGNVSLGGSLRLLATGGLAYIVVNHRLPDIRQNSRRAAGYLIAGVAAGIVYVLAITAVVFSLRMTLGYSLWATFGLTVVIVALILHPLVQLLQSAALRRVGGVDYDSAEAVRDYSASVSNILDIERLAEKVIALISETMGAREVRLLLVDHTRGEAPAAYRLETIEQGEEPAALAGTLSSENPVATYLADEGRPLAQYDIDLLPRYRKMAESERQWLAGLHVDVYVPVRTGGRWIGLLTLGPKLNGDRYFDSDMTLLDTLADQTAIALENARLVSDLVSLNRDLKQAYLDLEKAHHQLNELDRLKSAFIGSITHELRTPVANIQFSIQLIEKYGLGHLGTEQQEQFHQLVDAARHAKVMVDNLVNFAAFLAKQGELKLSEFNFAELMGETVVMLEPHARRNSVTLRGDVADEGVPAILGDRSRLGDAVYHLLQNAVKFTGPDGAATARCWARDGYLMFEVKDTGVGVPPDRLASLWDGFSQMADPLQRGLEGLGLGLALVKYVVTAHDGETTAQSTGEAGRGSTFGFRIPVAGPQPRAALTEEELDRFYPGLLDQASGPDFPAGPELQPAADLTPPDPGP